MTRKAKVKRCSRLSSKNQVTIPVGAIRELGLEPGDLIDIEVEESDRIVLRRHESRIEPFIGAIPGLRVDVEGLRDEWDQRERELWRDHPWDA